MRARRCQAGDSPGRLRTGVPSQMKQSLMEMRDSSARTCTYNPNPPGNWGKWNQLNVKLGPVNLVVTDVGILVLRLVSRNIYCSSIFSCCSNTVANDSGSSGHLVGVNVETSFPKPQHQFN